ncbi:MAG: hypothetical protein WBV82_07470 [Myxococcaceae bacterium]
MTTHFSAGDWAAVSGLGARKLVQVQPDGSLSYREDERDKKSEVTIGLDEARRRIRPLVGRQEAEELRNTLLVAGETQHAEDAYARSKEYRRVLKSNDLRLIVDTLRGIYRHPNPGYPEEQNQDLLEEAAFSELALVLDVKPAMLKGLAKRAAGQMILPDRSAELAAHAEIPELPGYEALGAFAVERRLAIGEFGVGSIELDARPGIWFAWFQDGDDLPPGAEDADDEYPPSKLVVVHAESFPRITELQRQMEPEQAELPIDGASMAVVDADAARDKSFVRAMEYTGHDIVQGRGVQVQLGGDGRGIAHVARGGGQAVLAVIELM